MKRIIAAILIMLILIPTTVFANEDNAINSFPKAKVKVNGELYQGENSAINYHGKTFVPADKFCEYFGLYHTYNEEEGTVKITEEAPIEDDFSLFTPSKERVEKSNVDLSSLTKYTVLIESYDHLGEVVSTGSGVIIGKGTVITNYHVLEDAFTFSVTKNDKEVIEYKDINLLCWDDYYDVAIFKIPEANEGIPLTNEDVILGESVVALGSPLGLLNSVSTGIVSGFPKLDSHKYIQTSAPISPGSSGGALVNLYGELIGITSSSMIDGQNVNLAIPSSFIKKYIDIAKKYPSDCRSFITEEGTSFLGEVDIMGELNGSVKMVGDDGFYLDGYFSHGKLIYVQKMKFGNYIYSGQIGDNEEPFGYGSFTVDDFLVNGYMNDDGYNGVVQTVNTTNSILIGPMKNGKKHGMFLSITNMLKVELVEFINDKEIYRKSILNLIK